jgi:hypothetical protein
MITQDQLYTIVNLVDLHSRTTDEEIGAKLKELISTVMDDLNNSEVKHELEN